MTIPENTIVAPSNWEFNGRSRMSTTDNAIVTKTCIIIKTDPGHCEIKPPDKSYQYSQQQMRQLKCFHVNDFLAGDRQTITNNNEIKLQPNSAIITEIIQAVADILTTDNFFKT